MTGQPIPASSSAANDPLPTGRCAHQPPPSDGCQVGCHDGAAGGVAAGRERATSCVQGTGLPARGYSWADFEPGNLAALKTGWRSEQMIAKHAEALTAVIHEDAPWTATTEHRLTVDLAAKQLAMAHLAFDALTSGNAKVSARILEAATAASRAAWRMLDELGMTPGGRAKLKAITAAGEQAERSLADLAAEGRAIIEARFGGSAPDSPQEPTDSYPMDGDSPEPGDGE